MVTFVEGVRNALRAFPCFALANGQYAYGAAAKLFPATPAGAISSGYGQLRRLLGCNPDDDAPEPEREFIGGQCVGVQYDVTWDRSAPGLNPPPGSVRVTGPLTVTRITEPPGGPAGCAPGLSFNEIILLSQSVPVGLYSGCGATVSNIQVTRVDGQPDSCGSPPINYPEPTDINVDIDVTFNTEEGDETTITVPFVFAPINVDLSGKFNIPFNFNLGGLDFSGTLEIAPNFNVNINPPTARRGSDDGTEDLPSGDPNEDVEPVPPSEKVIGVAVQSILIGEQKLTTIGTQNIPTIFAPRAGSIKFAYSLGVSTFWSDDIAIKGDRTFIPCPFSQGADFVAVSPEPGVQVQWRAITGFPLATVADVS